MRFILRYIGWYIWLGAYATFIGALIGLLCFSMPFLPFIVYFLPQLLPTALSYAAPLNLVVLPLVFHRVRTHRRRLAALRLAGVIGGFVSPVLGALMMLMIDKGPPFPLLRNPLQQSFGGIIDMWGFLIVGSIAGFCCARLFDRHGDKLSIFDVNGELEQARQAH